MEEIRLDREKQQRAMALTQLVAGGLTTSQVALALGLSVRQVERLRPRFKLEGLSCLVHGNTGKEPWNRTPETVADQIVGFATGKYLDFNFQHLTEMLAEFEGITTSPDTVRRTCLSKGVKPTKQKRRKPKGRARREPCAQEGEMLQLDGSKHDWLEGRGPKLVLICAIDDATKRKWAKFFEEETLEGYSEVLKMVAVEKGLPLAAYHDGLSTVSGGRRYSRKVSEESRAQLKRAYSELGVVCIIAGSPEAKGRVERSHGTDQDRLCSLLRLRQAKTLRDANLVLAEYLKGYNRKFTHAAANPLPAWQERPRSSLDDIFCIKEERVVAKDNTVKVYGQILSIRPGSPRRSYSGLTVNIHRRFDLTLGVFYQGRLVGGTPARSINRPTKSLRS